MRAELRFLLAIVLVLVVIVGTNLIFSPPPPGPGQIGGRESVEDSIPGLDTGVEEQEGETPEIPRSFTEEENDEAAELFPLPAPEGAADTDVVVEGPLYRLHFSTVGARLQEAVLTEYPDLNRGGPVQVIPEWSDGWFGHSLVVGEDLLDLEEVVFHVEPSGGLDLRASPENDLLRFVWVHPSDFRFEVEYRFDPESYLIEVQGRAGSPDQPLERGVVVTNLGSGLAVVEADVAGEERMAAYVWRGSAGDINSTPLVGAEPETVEEPIEWIGVRNRFFVLGIFGRSEGETLDYFEQLAVGIRNAVPTLSASQEIQGGGRFGHTIYLGPQDQGLLRAVGRSFNEVNPVGWGFLRPIIRPFASIVLTVLVFFHDSVGLSYGLALVVFGVAMRIVLFPLNHKAMKSQLRNMAVQPMVQEIQKKYKHDKQKQQQEMMKLHKEHGFNPLGGCVPMLLPWPVLIALFFVFQNTIELRGVPFMWLPDLAGPDPYYILPLALGASMWLLQWVSIRSIDNPNPTMKMMMWMMPVVMVVMFIWFGWASGLSLYYLTANVATLPQQVYIANQRKSMRGQPLPRRKR